MIYAIRSLILFYLLAVGIGVGVETASTSAETSIYSCKIAELHPTQFAVGLREVSEKVSKISKLMQKPEKFKKYLKKHPEPVVLGPDRIQYITDHHHLARALIELKVETTFCERIEDQSHLKLDEFWTYMDAKKWVYPYDEKGAGPLDFKLLPASVALLKDDPYRSLASAVRDAGGYSKTEIPFAEFAWAGFFRTRIQIGVQPGDFEKAVSKALAIAHSDEAKDLPGFIGVTQQYSLLFQR